MSFVQYDLFSIPNERPMGVHLLLLISNSKDSLYNFFFVCKLPPQEILRPEF